MKPFQAPGTDRFTHLSPCVAIVVLSLLGVLAGNLAAKEPGLEQWMPEDVIGFVKIAQPGKTFRKLMASDFRKQVEATSIYQLLKQQRDARKFFKQLEVIRDDIGREPADAIDDLLGEGAIAGVRLSFPPSFLFITRSKSHEALKAGFKSLKAFVRHTNNGVFPETSETTYNGVTIETAGNHVSYALKGNHFFISNSLKAVEDMLALAMGKAENSLAKSDAFSSVFSDKGPSELATAAVRPAYIPSFRLPENADNTLASLLFSGWLETLRVSDLLTLKLTHEGGKLGLTVRSNGSKEPARSARSIFFPTEGAAADSAELKRLESEGIVGLIHVRRDIAQWWQKREDFMNAGAAGGLLEANNFLSIFFGGVSFQDEVLPELERGITIVSRQLGYEGLKTKPQPQLPGFAVIFRLRDAAKFTQRLTSAFYQLMSLINLEVGKNQRMTPFSFTSEKVDGVNLAIADLNAPDGAPEKLGIEYNFSPSVAVVGSRAILSSNKELTRKLVKVFDGKPSSKTVRGSDENQVDLVKIRAPGLKKLLIANREFFANLMVLNEGISPEEADGRLNAIGELIDLFDGICLKTKFADRVATLNFTIDLAGPGGKKVPAKGDF